MNERPCPYGNPQNSSGDTSLQSMSMQLGIAGGSIAVKNQAFEILGHIYKFIDSFKEGPGKFRDIVTDLNNLLTAVSEIEASPNYPSLPKTSAIVLASQSCCARVESLNRVVLRIDAGFSANSKKKRTWAAAMAMLKDDSLKESLLSLEGAKSTLDIALGVFQFRKPKYNRSNLVS